MQHAVNFSLPLYLPKKNKKKQIYQLFSIQVLRVNFKLSAAYYNHLILDFTIHIELLVKFIKLSFFHPCLNLFISPDFPICIYVCSSPLINPRILIYSHTLFFSRVCLPFFAIQHPIIYPIN